MFFLKTKLLHFDKINFMLLESRLYSFIDQANGFTLHFLEGQKLIHDVAMTHGLKNKGFHFFRDSLLTFQLMLTYLKPGEGLGIYIDSEDPYFRFKIEMSEQGQMRTLLIPERFNQLPASITGKCRLVKTIPSESHPYTSIVDLVNTNLSDVVNKILKDSYQLPSQVFLSEVSDQSILLLKLPSIDINKIQTNYSLSVSEFWQKNQEAFNEIFSGHSQDYQTIQTSFENLGLLFLGSKEIIFKCNCSRERMVSGIWSLVKSAGIDHVFLPDEPEIETKCDYCNVIYKLQRSEFLS
jgi:molecular chaperone Hsp33